ncbi:hypothetical protein SMU20_07301 [Streptococcus mutans 15JP3]|nr:hypothetical protein SMU20_07301 [Streptococcus mutans 15JP3]EMC55833.1 hypothetical protein SMU107_07735 [Streptococcus mutans R221]
MKEKEGGKMIFMAIMCVCLNFCLVGQFVYQTCVCLVLKSKRNGSISLGNHFTKLEIVLQ